MKQRQQSRQIEKLWKQKPCRWRKALNIIINNLREVRDDIHGAAIKGTFRKQRIKREFLKIKNKMEQLKKKKNRWIRSKCEEVSQKTEQKDKEMERKGKNTERSIPEIQRLGNGSYKKRK